MYRNSYFMMSRLFSGTYGCWNEFCIGWVRFMRSPTHCLRRLIAARCRSWRSPAPRLGLTQGCWTRYISSKTWNNSIYSTTNNSHGSNAKCSAKTQNSSPQRKPSHGYGRGARHFLRDRKQSRQELSFKKDILRIIAFPPNHLQWYCLSVNHSDKRNGFMMNK